MELAAPSAVPLNDPRLARCGFAKLQGDGIEYFVRKYEVTVGRNSKNSTLDLILGESTTISRQHATIRYNFDNRCFELVVLGKNGVQVESRGETHLYTPDSPPTPLRSRDLLIMGEKRFYFLLPRAMGGPRKRRRMEPSPAPPPLAPVPGGGVVTHPQAAVQPPQAHQGVREAASQLQQLAPPVALQSQALQGVLDSAAGAADVPPLQGHMVLHAQAPDYLGQQQQCQQPLAVAGGRSMSEAGVAGGLDAQPQEEEDALMLHSGGPLGYDNGAPYGYDGDPNGFSGGF